MGKDMAGKKLIIEMGKFTRERGLQVHELLEREVKNESNRLERTPLPKPRKTVAEIREKIVVEALGRVLGALPYKDDLEKKVGHPVSWERYYQAVGVDRFSNGDELRKRCSQENLPHTGDKKVLALRLLMKYGA